MPIRSALRALALALALWFAPSARAQPVIQTTAYTRGLLIQATAAACRAYLGITNGTSYSIIVDTNGFGVNFDTSVFFMQGSTNLTLQGAPATAGFLPLTNVLLNGATTVRRVALGNAGGTLTVDPSLADEFSLTLTNDLTLGFTLSTWGDGHNVRLRAANTGNFTLTFTNVAYWYPNGNSTQITNDWGAGIHNSFAFWKDAGDIYASDKEGVSGGSGTTINPTDGFIPYRISATVFGDSWLRRIGTNGLTYPDGVSAFAIGSDTNVFLRYDDAFFNLSLGRHALQLIDQNFSGNNVAFGENAGRSATQAANLVAVGHASAYSLTTGSDDTAVGQNALHTAITASANSAIGSAALYRTTGERNTGLGYVAGYTNTTGNDTVFVGYNANPLAATDTNTIVVGAAAIGHGKNTATIGDANVTALYLGNTLLGSANQTPAASVYFGGQYSFSGGSGGIQPTNIRSGNLAAGTTDLYTVPAGQRLMVTLCTTASTNATSTATFLQLKTNGVYYRYSANHNVSVSLVQVTVGALNDPFLFEPGETVALSNSLAGVNVVISGFLISTNSNCYSPRIFALGAGNNTLYTCPAGKCAVAMPLPLSGVGVNSVYINDSGGSRTLFYYVVPSGSTPLLSNAQYVGATVTDKNRLALNGNILFPGDSLVFSSDATTAVQWARCTVAEIPFP